MGTVAAIASIAGLAGAGGMLAGSAMSKKPDALPPLTSTADNATNAEQEAGKAAEKRKRLYAGVGRSSTILTGPSGLNDNDVANKLWPNQNQGKTLLGL